MKNYAVFLEGSNVKKRADTLGDLQGFFVTIRVEANTEQEAANQAIQFVKTDPEILWMSPEDAAVTSTVQSKVAHDLAVENKMKNIGYQFFPMETE